MKRLIKRCNLKEMPTCSILNRANRGNVLLCENRTEGCYCINPYLYYKYDENEDEEYLASYLTLLDVADRLGQLEDEAEQREKGCGECIRKSCTTCTSKIYCYVCDECDNYSKYECMNYCPNCGRKLVE